MTLSLTITREYLKQKVVEQRKTGVFHERRGYTPFWRKRIGSPAAWSIGGEAVFLCGCDTFRATVRRITIEPTPDGIEDVVPGALCYNIVCSFDAINFVAAFVER